ncbi:hypothetical protein SAMN04488505_103436 [Chitinophaga rupis]|uniref:Uncharacterized protein n=1 Tax=Chitinophaga rupis TaxID=573321 RepID=A0A1H7VT64_9BACT|nr:hypothetical protein SAMN04488505_103436 [Chitinophaga rupis]
MNEINVKVNAAKPGRLMSRHLLFIYDLKFYILHSFASGRLTSYQEPPLLP